MGEPWADKTGRWLHRGVPQKARLGGETCQLKLDTDSSTSISFVLHQVRRRDMSFLGLDGAADPFGRHREADGVVEDHRLKTTTTIRSIQSGSTMWAPLP